jgi:hypothetical protein
MFGVSKDILRTVEVQMAHSKRAVFLVVLAALAVASVGGAFGFVSSWSGLHGVSGLHW